MSARDVIGKAGADAFAAFLDEYRIRAQNPGAGPASTRDWLEEACGRYRETFLSALTAAGIGTYDTRTHAAVPREMSEAIYDAGRRGQEDGDLYDVWREQIAAAEAGAKETE